MFKWVAKLFRKQKPTPSAPRHISTVDKTHADNFLKYTFRVTGKLVWTEPVRESRLDGLATETLGPGKIVAFGDITHRPIKDTAFVAFYRDYYVERE